MRKLREILRLKYEAKLPHRAIGRACAVGVGTVSVHVKRAQEAGLTWPLPKELDDAALEARLFRRAAPLHVPHPLPDLCVSGITQGPPASHSDEPRVWHRLFPETD